MPLRSRISSCTSLLRLWRQRMSQSGRRLRHAPDTPRDDRQRREAVFGFLSRPAPVAEVTVTDVDRDVLGKT